MCTRALTIHDTFWRCLVCLGAMATLGLSQELQSATMQDATRPAVMRRDNGEHNRHVILDTRGRSHLSNERMYALEEQLEKEQEEQTPANASAVVNATAGAVVNATAGADTVGANWTIGTAPTPAPPLVISAGSAASVTGFISIEGDTSLWNADTKSEGACEQAIAMAAGVKKQDVSMDDTDKQVTASGSTQTLVWKYTLLCQDAQATTDKLEKFDLDNITAEIKDNLVAANISTLVADGSNGADKLKEGGTAAFKVVKLSTVGGNSTTAGNSTSPAPAPTTVLSRENSIANNSADVSITLSGEIDFPITPPEAGFGEKAGVKTAVCAAIANLTKVDESACKITDSKQSDGSGKMQYTRLMFNLTMPGSREDDVSSKIMDAANMEVSNKIKARLTDNGINTTVDVKYFTASNEQNPGNDTVEYYGANGSLIVEVPKGGVQAIKDSQKAKNVIRQGIADIAMVEVDYVAISVGDAAASDSGVNLADAVVTLAQGASVTDPDPDDPDDDDTEKIDVSYEISSPIPMDDIRAPDLIMAADKTALTTTLKNAFRTLRKPSGAALKDPDDNVIDWKDTAVLALEGFSMELPPIPAVYIGADANKMVEVVGNITFSTNNRDIFMDEGNASLAVKTAIAKTCGLSASAIEIKMHRFPSESASGLGDAGNDNANETAADIASQKGGTGKGTGLLAVHARKRIHSHDDPDAQEDLVVNWRTNVAMRQYFGILYSMQNVRKSELVQSIRETFTEVGFTIEPPTLMIQSMASGKKDEPKATPAPTPVPTTAAPPPAPTPAPDAPTPAP